MLPRDDIVILIGIVVELIGAVTRQGCAIRIVEVDVGEGCIQHAFQSQFVWPIPAIAPDSAELLTIASAESCVEMVQQVGLEDIVVAESNIVRSLIGRTRIERSAIDDVSSWAPVIIVASANLLPRSDVLVDANLIHIGVGYVLGLLKEI